MSLVNGGSLFLVAQVPDSSSSSVGVWKSEAEIANGILLDAFTIAPPRCKIVAVSQNAMAYVALVGQEDGLMFSNPYQPHKISLGTLMTFDTGDRSAITGAKDFRDRLYVFKRDGLWEAQLILGAPRSKSIKRGDGCIGHNTIVGMMNRLVWLSERGPVTMVGGTVKYVGGAIESYFRDTLEQSSLPQMSACYYATRGQFIFTCLRDDTVYWKERIAVTTDDEEPNPYVAAQAGAANSRWSVARYQGPNCTVLTEHLQEDVGAPRLVGGTQEGFLVWLDREDSNLVMQRETTAHGVYDTTAGGGSTTSKIIVTGADTNLAGQRGAVVRWSSGGVEYEAVVIESKSTGLLLDRATSVAPSSGDVVTVGQRMLDWRTRQHDFGTPDLRKRPYFLDVTRDVTAGTLYVAGYKDFVATDYVGKTISLAVGVDEGVNLDGVQNGKYVQFRIYSKVIAGEAARAAELFDTSFRILDLEQR